ncbi:MAG: MFS transporter [Steroidobacteraceae bacterium]
MAANQHSDGRIDVIDILDRAPFAGLSLAVSIYTVIAMIFDGFDIQAIAFAAPKVMAEWQIDRNTLAPVFMAGLVGMAVGAIGVSWISDRFGRRVALLLGSAVIALMSLGAAFSGDVTELTVWRFLTGIGLGGVVPTSTALMVEYAPLKVRNLVVALTVVGVPIGGMLGAEVAAQIIEPFGWRAVFMVGAILPALLCIAMFFGLPESPRYLARHKARFGELARILNRISGSTTFAANNSFYVREELASESNATLAAIFSRALRYDTAIIWLIFITNIFAVYAFFNWLPVVLSSVGLPITTALRGSLFFNLGGVVAAIVLASLVSRFGSRFVLTIVGIGAVLSTFAIGLVPVDSAAAGQSTMLLMSAMTLSGACILGMQVAMYAVAAHAYPTNCRSTGVGSASGVARLGGIVSSFAGSILLAMGEGMSPFFTGIAGVLVLTLIGVVLLRRHMPATD